MSKDIAEANYNQNCINLEGRLYTRFMEYDNLPQFTKVKAYCDTADTGSDYLCNIIYCVYENEAYLLDVYYTQKHMEITEPETARRLIEYNTNWWDCESNNGGRGFARNVQVQMKNLGSNKCHVNWFHQSKNKQARIISNATWVMDHIYFPKNWGSKWPDFYEALYGYQREGKNEHDDAPDALTGVAEQFNQRRGTHW